MKPGQLCNVLVLRVPPQFRPSIAYFVVFVQRLRHIKGITYTAATLSNRTLQKEERHDESSGKGMAGVPNGIGSLDYSLGMVSEPTCSRLLSVRHSHRV